MIETTLPTLTHEEYRTFLSGVASSEHLASVEKIREHGLEEDDVFALLKVSARGIAESIGTEVSTETMKAAYWAYAMRHISAIENQYKLSDKERIKRMLDLMGYMMLGIALYNKMKED